MKHDSNEAQQQGDNHPLKSIERGKLMVTATAASASAASSWPSGG